MKYKEGKYKKNKGKIIAMKCNQVKWAETVAMGDRTGKLWHGPLTSPGQRGTLKNIFKT